MTGNSKVGRLVDADEPGVVVAGQLEAPLGIGTHDVESVANRYTFDALTLRVSIVEDSTAKRSHGPSCLNIVP
jgi:hypothetical protein